MANKYILSIDQSTQGTKCLILDQDGHLLHRQDIPHRQIINESGWVSHDPTEIYRNLLECVRSAIQFSGIDPSAIVCLGLSNQRETSVVWNKETGEPVCDAIVWQCSRARDICDRVIAAGFGPLIQKHTGIPASAFFPAAKYAWILENVDGTRDLADRHALCFGTIDTWMVYKLTGGTSYKTDYSNASRTQLFNIVDLCWDEEICAAFGLDAADLPEVCDSDALYGTTDFEGILPHKIPICGVIGDSQGALFGQGCLQEGMTKATYGSGTSVVMNAGESPVFSKHGVVTSIAWSRAGKPQYIMEGNIIYTGSVITWLKEIGLITSASETQFLAEQAHKDDTTYLVPAFTGLGAPYWDSNCTASISGMTRLTGKPELARAALDCIAYQIRDILDSMQKDSGVCIHELYVDGGATKNTYLMQFQSDILDCCVAVSTLEELSGIGAAYIAGISQGLLDESVFQNVQRTVFNPTMALETRQTKYAGWRQAVQSVLTHP